MYIKCNNFNLSCYVYHVHIFLINAQLAFSCSKSIKETIEKVVKNAQS